MRLLTQATSNDAARHLRTVLLSFCLVSVGCKAPVPAEPSTQGKGAADQQTHRGPLTDYVAAAGLRWLVVMNPARLLASTRQQTRKLVSEAALQAFFEDSAIDLNQTRELVIASYPYSTVYGVRTDALEAIRERFVARLTTDPIRARPGPKLQKLTGVVGTTPIALLTIEPQTAIFAVGSLRPATIAALYAQRRLKSPSVLNGAGLASLAGNSSPPMVRVFWLLGSGQEERLGTLGARWLGTRADVEAANDRTQIRLTLRGDWDETSAQALVSALARVEESSLGEILAWPTAEAPRRRGSLLVTSMTWNTPRLLDGLLVLLRGEITDIANLPLRTKAPYGVQAAGTTL